jgi:phage baseplate assembly protein W|tara:strand:+ start:426 stop:854 length:429 start_codon:yes stop_codon:yes gene_type:complete
MGRARSVLELDLDPDVTIGLGLPMEHDDVNGFFPGTSTTLSQTGSNIRNLLLTNRGERVGQPTFGADILLTLFEPMSDQLINSVEEKVSEAIADWMPHVLVNKLVVEPDETEVNQLNIELEFSLTMNPDIFETITLSFATGT